MIAKPAPHNRAILIGTSYYGGDEPKDMIAGVPQNIEQLEDCLAEFSDVIPFVDQKAAGDLLDRVEGKAREAKNALLLYYAGHGFLRNNFLYLSLADTQLERCQTTALRFDLLAECVARSPAQKKIIVLDCCHAEQGLDDVGVLVQHLNTKDVYAIGAASREQAALAMADGEPTLFTKHLVRALTRGVPAVPPTSTPAWEPIFTMEQLAAHLVSTFDSLRRADPTIPNVVVVNHGLGSRIRLRRSPAGISSPSPALFRTVIGREAADELLAGLGASADLLGRFTQTKFAYELLTYVRGAAEPAKDRRALMETNTSDGEPVNNKFRDCTVAPYGTIQRLRELIPQIPDFIEFCELANEYVDIVSRFSSEVRAYKGTCGQFRDKFNARVESFVVDLRELEKRVEQLYVVCRKQMGLAKQAR
jgi:hypothetical protein